MKKSIVIAAVIITLLSLGVAFGTKSSVSIGRRGGEIIFDANSAAGIVLGNTIILPDPPTGTIADACQILWNGKISVVPDVCATIWNAKSNIPDACQAAYDSTKATVDEYANDWIDKVGPNDVCVITGIPYGDGDGNYKDANGYDVASVLGDQLSENYGPNNFVPQINLVNPETLTSTGNASITGLTYLSGTGGAGQIVTLPDGIQVGSKKIVSMITDSNSIILRVNHETNGSPSDYNCNDSNDYLSFTWNGHLWMVGCDTTD